MGIMAQPGGSPSIDAVLEAERDAEQQVAEASRMAEGVVAAARADARRIAKRADARARRVHERGLSLAEEQIAVLREEFADRQRASQRSLADEALLGAAVGDVVDWLLGNADTQEGT